MKELDDLQVDGLLVQQIVICPMSDVVQERTQDTSAHPSDKREEARAKQTSFDKKQTERKTPSTRNARKHKHPKKADERCFCFCFFFSSPADG